MALTFGKVEEFGFQDFAILAFWSQKNPCLSNEGRQPPVDPAGNAHNALNPH